MNEQTTRITKVGTVIRPVHDLEADPELIRMGEGVPPMFTFRDPDGNHFRMVERS